MDTQSIQLLILLVFLSLIGLSVLLWLLKQVWMVINTPVAIAILIGLLAIFLQFTTLNL
jgi:hypothetical protein